MKKKLNRANYPIFISTNQFNMPIGFYNADFRDFVSILDISLEEFMGWQNEIWRYMPSKKLTEFKEKYDEIRDAELKKLL